MYSSERSVYKQTMFWLVKAKLFSLIFILIGSGTIWKYIISLLKNVVDGNFMSPEENSFHMCRSSILGAYQSQQNFSAPSVFNMQSPLPAGRIFVSESGIRPRTSLFPGRHSEYIRLCCRFLVARRQKRVRVFHQISIIVFSGKIKWVLPRNRWYLRYFCITFEHRLPPNFTSPNSIDIFCSEEKDK